MSAKALLGYLVRLGLAIAPGAVVAWWVTTLADEAKIHQVLGVGGGGVLALGMFFGAARLLRISEVTNILAAVLRR